MFTPDPTLGFIFLLSYEVKVLTNASLTPIQLSSIYPVYGRKESDPIQAQVE